MSKLVQDPRVIVRESIASANAAKDLLPEIIKLINKELPKWMRDSKHFVAISGGLVGPTPTIKFFSQSKETAKNNVLENSPVSFTAIINPVQGNYITSLDQEVVINFKLSVNSWIPGIEKFKAPAARKQKSVKIAIKKLADWLNKNQSNLTQGTP